VTEVISADKAAAFISGLRKIRDGLDDFCNRIDGAAAAENLSQQCDGLSVPDGAVELAQMLPVIAAILGHLDQTIGETGNEMRKSADEVSRKVREIELEIRKGSQ
jgi:hypothetical protein